MKALFCMTALLTALPLTVTASDSRYDSIANHYNEQSLDKKTIEAAKMQGECMVELKELTFKKKEKFDPIAEWINYRSISLLSQYSPCEVLIMMEVADQKIRERTNP